MQGEGRKPGECARFPSEKVELLPPFPIKGRDFLSFFFVPYFLLVEDMDNDVKEASPLGRGHWRRKTDRREEENPHSFFTLLGGKTGCLE